MALTAIRTLVRSCGATAVALLLASPCAAQSLTSELSATTGASTDEVAAVSGQVRLFGEFESELRFLLEGSWATRAEEEPYQDGRESDAFGAAYPYDGRFHVVEAYAERTFRHRSLLASARTGLYRTPFGIHDRGDHAYAGFLRAPLIRYEDYFGLSNNFIEAGIDMVAGTPTANVEVSLGAPADIGEAQRRAGLDPVVRAQFYGGPLVVGVSHMRSKPYDQRSFVRGSLVFSGVDVRWMTRGVQIRGEWIAGRPFDGVSTTGWYVDAIVHRPVLGPVTLVGRAEDLDYDAGPFSDYLSRYTVGARIQVTLALVAQLNVLYQPSEGTYGSGTALDVGLTYVLRQLW